MELGLAGFVRNDSAGVVIEVEGPEVGLEDLCLSLVKEPPPLAIVSSVDVTTIGPIGDQAFRIVATAAEGPPAVPVGVDTATCDACLAEVTDPADRRYRYPFTNCTNCGPRYSIVVAVPYDRAATTMAGFDDVRRLSGRIPRSRRPPLSRPAQRVSGLRATAAVVRSPTAPCPVRATTPSTPPSPCCVTTASSR